MAPCPACHALLVVGQKCPKHMVAEGGMQEEETEQTEQVMELDLDRPDDRKLAAKRFLSPTSSNAEPPAPRARTEEPQNGGGTDSASSSVLPQTFVDPTAPSVPPPTPPQRKGVEIFWRPSKHYQNKWKI